MVVGRNMFPKTVQNSCFDGGPLHSLHHLKLAFSKNKVTSQGASGLVSCRWNCQWSPFAGSWCCSQWWHLARKHQPNEAVYPPMVASNISKSLFSLVKKHVLFDVETCWNVGFDQLVDGMLLKLAWKSRCSCPGHQTLPRSFFLKLATGWMQLSLDPVISSDVPAMVR